MLAEAGALAGTLLVWAFLSGWALAAYGAPPANTQLGLLLLGAMIGGTTGAVAMPVLSFSLLRRTPLGRALGFPLVGALLGLVAAAVLTPFPATTPISALVPMFGLVGLLLGAIGARVADRRACSTEIV